MTHDFPATQDAGWNFLCGVNDFKLMASEELFYQLFPYETVEHIWGRFQEMDIVEFMLYLDNANRKAVFDFLKGRRLVK